MATAIGSYATASALKTRAGITDTSDDTLLGAICDQVNSYIEGMTRRVLAPIGSATYLYDGDGSCELFLPRTADGTQIGGIRAITVLEVAQFTGGTFTTISAGQYFLRDRARNQGPFDTLILSDHPTSGYGYFPRGLATVRITGTAGWSSIPDEVSEVAVVAAVRAWHAREAGQTDIVGTDEMGRPLVSRFFSARDFATLQDYAIGDVLVSG